MENNTCYKITETNIAFLTNLTGHTPERLQANIGWYAVYDEKWYPHHWVINPYETVKQYNTTILDSPV